MHGRPGSTREGWRLWQIGTCASRRRHLPTYPYARLAAARTCTGTLRRADADWPRGYATDGAAWRRPAPVLRFVRKLHRQAYPASMNPLAPGMPACSASSLATPRHRKAEVLTMPQDGADDIDGRTARDDASGIAAFAVRPDEIPDLREFVEPSDEIVPPIGRLAKRRRDTPSDSPNWMDRAIDRHGRRCDRDGDVKGTQTPHVSIGMPPSKITHGRATRNPRVLYRP